MQIKEQSRWPVAAFVPLLAGWLWILLSAAYGFGALIAALFPATFLLATGFSLLLWSGSRKIPQFMAFGGLFSAILALVAIIWLGIVAAIPLFILGAASYVVAGYVGIAQEPLPEGAPHPEVTPGLAAKAALDENLLAWFTTIARIPAGETARRIVSEVAALERYIADTGDRPDPFFPPPPVLSDVETRPGRWGKYTFERLQFSSDYAPPAEMPGAQRWHAFVRNRTAHAWMLRHPGAPRPWVIGIHGYRMGLPMLDLALFRPDWLHQTLGFNMLIPVLPLHGPRRAGVFSGDFYMDGDVLNIIHAEAQAMWDIRRLLGWLRHTQGAARIGVLGYSLGGYNAALLATVEADLDCVIAGIPATDLPSLLWRHIPEIQARQLASLGVDRESVAHACRHVSPLEAPCRVAWSDRFLFAGTVDRIVPPGQVLALWHHWQQPVISWYSGAHLTFRGRPEVRHLITKALTTRLSESSIDTPDGISGRADGTIA